MEFHAWMQNKLEDSQKAIDLYNLAKKEFKVDKDLHTFKSIANDILEAHTSKLHDFLEEIYHVRAFINLCEEDYQESIEDLNMVLKINPQNSIAKRDRDLAYCFGMKSDTAEEATISCLLAFNAN